MIQTPSNTVAGARKASVTQFRRRRPRAGGGAARTGGSAVTPAPAIYLPYAFFAAASSLAAMPFTFFGFERKSWNSFHSPCPLVAPKAAGWRSDMSKRKILAFARAAAVFRFRASLYADGLTFLFADEKPPRFAQ